MGLPRDTPVRVGSSRDEFFDSPRCWRVRRGNVTPCHAESGMARFGMLASPPKTSISEGIKKAAGINETRELLPGLRGSLRRWFERDDAFTKWTRCDVVRLKLLRVARKNGHSSVWLSTLAIAALLLFRRSFCISHMARCNITHCVFDLFGSPGCRIT